jgi:hypothetical protein
MVNFYSQSLEHGVAQVVSRRLPTAAARVRNLGKSCVGICGDQSSTGAGFLRVFRFPCQSFILPVALQSSFRVGAIGQYAASIGLGCTPASKESPEANRRAL